MKTQKKGRWTALFTIEPLLEQQMRLAKEVRSEHKLVSVEGMEDEFSYVHIILDDLPGWEEPLWMTDTQWLYLRRPQGLWKTRLPLSHQGRIGVVFQKRIGTDRVYGGTQIGRDFTSKIGWHYLQQPKEPRELDFVAGVDEGGREVGAFLARECEGPSDRLVLCAGPAFDKEPSAWTIDSDRIIATGSDGRSVAFAYHKSLMLLAAAKAGQLWLRFEVLSNPWMEPIEFQVKV